MLTLQTVHACVSAFCAAFFCSLALCPCCFFIFACFSAALACDCAFCWPRAIVPNDTQWSQQFYQFYIKKRHWILTYCDYRLLKEFVWIKNCCNCFCGLSKSRLTTMFLGCNNSAAISRVVQSKRDERNHTIGSFDRASTQVNVTT